MVMSCVQNQPIDIVQGLRPSSFFLPNTQPFIQKMAPLVEAITPGEAHHKGGYISQALFLGQEQDFYGGSFDAKQSLVEVTGDVNMWDFVLSPEQTNKVYVGGTLSPNVLNWQALKYKAQGDVFIKAQLWS